MAADGATAVGEPQDTLGMLHCSLPRPHPHPALGPALSPRLRPWGNLAPLVVAGAVGGSFVSVDRWVPSARVMFTSPAPCCSRQLKTAAI